MLAKKYVPYCMLMEKFLYVAEDETPLQWGKKCRRIFGQPSVDNQSLFVQRPTNLAGQMLSYLMNSVHTQNDKLLFSTPEVHLAQYHLAQQRPLSAILFRVRYFCPKVHLAQNLDRI